MIAPIRFGTDGIRGPAGEWPVSEGGARAIGLGIASWTHQGTIVVGRDTRMTSPSLAAAVIEGLIAGGAYARDLGVCPTAAVSCAVAAGPAAAGVVITASHNPWQDNGIKVVDANGEKLIDPSPLTQWFGIAQDKPGGRGDAMPDPLAAWRRALPTVDLQGRRILLDAAHGAGHECAAAVLQDCGAELVCVGTTPTGRNINDGVGAMHPPTDLQGCDLGICLDGDADRLVLIDPEHGVLDGDDLLWMLACEAQGPVVGTIMTNGGLEEALGGRLVRTSVGDAQVWAEMVRIDARLGGEPSGHLMLRDAMPTSDGLLTALRILQLAGSEPLPVMGWTRWPQALRNVRDVLVDADIAAIGDARSAGQRVVVRASGTEPLVRVMVEGDAAEHWADRIAEALPVSH